MTFDRPSGLERAAAGSSCAQAAALLRDEAQGVQAGPRPRPLCDARHRDPGLRQALLDPAALAKSRGHGPADLDAEPWTFTRTRRARLDAAPSVGDLAINTSAIAEPGYGFDGWPRGMCRLCRPGRCTFTGERACREPPRPRTIDEELPRLHSKTSAQELAGRVREIASEYQGLSRPRAVGRAVSVFGSPGRAPGVCATRSRRDLAGSAIAPAGIRTTCEAAEPLHQHRPALRPRARSCSSATPAPLRDLSRRLAGRWMRCWRVQPNTTRTIPMARRSSARRRVVELAQRAARRADRADLELIQLTSSRSRSVICVERGFPTPAAAALAPAAPPPPQ